MGRVAVDADAAALLRCLEAVAEARYVVDGNDMIGLAEDAQDRTTDFGDQLIDRCRPQLVALPFSPTDGAIEHHHAGNVAAVRRDQYRLAAGLAYADNPDTRGVNLRRHFQVMVGVI